MLKYRGIEKIVTKIMSKIIQKLNTEHFVHFLQSRKKLISKMCIDLCMLTENSISIHFLSRSIVGQKLYYAN
jgi:hypothetical protein